MWLADCPLVGMENLWVKDRKVEFAGRRPSSEYLRSYIARETRRQMIDQRTDGWRQAPACCEDQMHDPLQAAPVGQDMDEPAG